MKALIKGTTSDVGGKMSATINIKTVKANRLVITKDIRSPDSVLTMNDSKDSTETKRHYQEPITRSLRLLNGVRRTLY